MLGGAQQGDAAARHDAFFHRRTGRMHRVINAILALPDLDLGRAADADHRDAACKLGHTLLQLLTVVVRGSFLDLRLDLIDPRFDVGLLAGAADDGGVFLVDHHLLGATEHGERDVLHLDAEIFRDRLTAGQHRDVLQHGLAAIAEARSLHSGNLEAATQTVDDEGGERFALDVFRDDDERLAGLHHGFQQRKQFVQVGELLLIDQDVGVIEFNAHLVGVGDEVGRDVAAVELHAFDDVKFGLERLGFFNRDDALVADLLHGVGEELADFCVAIGGDGADLGDFLVRGDLLGVLDEVGDHGFHSQIDTALEIHRVHAGGNCLGAFLHDGRGQHGRGGGAVAGRIRRLGGNFAHHLGAHVLELVLKLDFLGDGDAVLGDARRAKRLIEHHIAAFGAESYPHRVGEYVDPVHHSVTSIDREFHFLGSHVVLLKFDCAASLRGSSTVPAKRQPIGFGAKTRRFVREGSGGLSCTSSFHQHPHQVAFLHDYVLDAVELDFGPRPLAEQHSVADLDIDRNELAALIATARPDGNALPFLGFFLRGIRDDDPATALLLSFDPFDDDAIVKRTKFHGFASSPAGHFLM